MNETMLLAADSLAPFEEAKPASAPPTPPLAASAPFGSPVETGMKTCPVCSARVFADMDTCFNCMYLFGSNPALEKKAASKALPAVGTDALGNASGRPLERERTDMPSALPKQVRPCVQGDLFAELLVELHGFLGEFLLNRGIDLKKL